jgi:hypothetical protein
MTMEQNLLVNGIYIGLEQAFLSLNLLNIKSLRTKTK